MLVGRLPQLAMVLLEVGLRDSPQDRTRRWLGVQRGEESRQLRGHLLPVVCREAG